MCEVKKVVVSYSILFQGSAEIEVPDQFEELSMGVEEVMFDRDFLTMMREDDWDTSDSLELRSYETEDGKEFYFKH